MPLAQKHIEKRGSAQIKSSILLSALSTPGITTIEEKKISRNHTEIFLKQINADFDNSWVLEYHHHKVDGAQPIVRTNYSEQIPDHRTPIKNLYLGNTTQICPEDRGTNYSVRLGKHLSSIVCADLVEQTE